GNQFSLTRAALSTCGRAKSKFLSVRWEPVHGCRNLTAIPSSSGVNRKAQTVEKPSSDFRFGPVDCATEHGFRWNLGRSTEKKVVVFVKSLVI
ncbi:MAG: hypothetical protein WCL11_17810, partial [Verrucomicrobiota bacterium]